MGPVKALFDSNILIDFLAGKDSAEKELNHYDEPAISRITWMEVLVGARDEAETELRRSFLAKFVLIELDEKIAREAIALRRRLRLKLPDAIIFATARVRESILVTRNHRDFPANEPGIRIPY
jgi:predicted nucleic acid-binding protein